MACSGAHNYPYPYPHGGGTRGYEPALDHHTPVVICIQRDT